MARQYLEKGLSVIPLKPRGKEPLVPWKQYQERLPTEEEIEKWFGSGKEANIGIVTGRVSRNLVVIDFDNEEEFKGFVEKLKNSRRGLQIAISNTWIVKTGKGYHIYLRLPDAELIPRTKVRLTEGIDLKAEGGYVVAPPSVHPSGKRYEFVKVENELLGPPDVEEPVTLTEDEWEELLKLLSPREASRSFERTRDARFKELRDEDLLKLKELLKDAWVEGQRQLLALYLSGWMAKARVHPTSVAKLFRIIAEEKGDRELESRLSTIYYSYRKRYGNASALEELDSLIEEWRNQGILRRSVSKGINASLQRVRGKSGVQEILENTFGEERALEVIREIEEILGVSSPFRDSIIEILDYEKQLYAVANLRRLVVVRARRVTDGRRYKLTYKEKVFIGAPTSVTGYHNPLGGVTKFEVVWEANTRPKPLVIGPATIEDIVERLKLEGLVLSRRLAGDVLSAIINVYIRKGKAEVREEIEASGFYFLDGKLKAVRLGMRETSADELREALELLNDLARWFGHIRDKFATVIKWGIIAPFIYAMKQKGRWVPWLYLYGASHTGKSTLGEIVLSIWGLDSRFRKTGASVDTIARLGHVLSQSTFPTLINEPGNAIAREDIIEAIKNAIESTVVRGKFVRGSYSEIPSLSPLILASNKVLPQDDALLRRLIVVSFTYGERVSKDKAREFERNVKPRLGKLRALGAWIAGKVLEDPSLLELPWEELAEELLEEAYRAAGLEVPSWVEERHEEDLDIYEQIKEQIREFLIEEINKAYFKAVGRVVVEKVEDNRYSYERRSALSVPPEERVQVVLEGKLLPWAYSKDGKAFFTRGFARALEERIGNLGGLKGVAELLGWEYKDIKDGRRVRKGAVVPFEDLVSFLFS
jgi:beta-phosphoglucomutase-like phosphatase (HAD superfamily)